MFNLDFSSKRARLALRFFTYGVMTVASVVLTVLLVLVALGYRLDKDFNFSQGGLVQFRSFPSGASVTVDGKQLGFNTPDKANLSAGQHSVSMELGGYRGWSKTVDLAAGQLLWLNYARLLPNSITTTTLKEYPSVASTLPSPDRHWLLMHMKQGEPDLILVDYNDEKKPVYTSLSLPDSLFSKKDGKYGTFTLVEWDLQSKFVIVRHQNGDTTEFARIDRSRPADAVNLTKLFSLNVREAHFSGSNANIIFARTDDVLRRLDVNGPTASAALVTGLRDFSVYGEDTIAFTSLQEKTTGDQTTASQMAGIYKGGKITPVREFAADKKLTIAYNEYDNHSYFALNEQGTTTVDIIRDATVTGASKPANLFTQLSLAGAPASLSFSNNGRMLVAQRGNAFVTYDIETDKKYQKQLTFGSDTTAKFKWLDDYYLYSDEDGRLRIFEFDGTNEHDIAGVAPGRDVMLSANGKQLLAISQSSDAGVLLLQAAKLTLEN